MISKEIQTLLDTIENYKYPSYLIAQPHEPTIEVGEIASKAARYYEKARYAIDYTEEHLLRRTAIERILRRRLTIEFSSEKDCLSFLVELIQAGYIPNGELPERVIPHVQAIIDKALFFQSLTERIYPSEQRSHFKRRIISFATLEIENLFFPSIVDEAVIQAFYEKVKNHIDITNSHITEEEKDVQIYLASRKGLFKDDNTTLFYHLWIMHYPEWNELNEKTEDNDERLKEIAENFAEVNLLIEREIENTLYMRLVPKIKNDIIYFSAIRKIVSTQKESSEQIIKNPDQLNFIIREAVEEEYIKTHAQMRKSTYGAIIYVLITKMFLAGVIELPYDLLVFGKINYLAILINTTFHPLLLFGVTANITKPDRRNTDRIVAGVNSVIYGNGHKKIILQEEQTKGALQYVAFLLYLLVFVLSFGSILWLLSRLGFNIVGIGLFLLFLTFVSYFGLRVRFIAKKWVVQNDKQTFTSFLWDLFTLPIISLGHWFSLKFSSVNIFIFIMDFIIEAPFKVVLKTLDTFTHFIKDKKEEIY